MTPSKCLLDEDNFDTYQNSRNAQSEMNSRLMTWKLNTRTLACIYMCEDVRNCVYKYTTMNPKHETFLQNML